MNFTQKFEALLLDIKEASNKNNDSERSNRKDILRKIAKKTPSYGVSGKHNRKSLEKILNKAKTRFNELKNEVARDEAELSKLQSGLEVKREELKNARFDIIHCHDLMRNMDFSGASEVRIGKDSDDVAYACDGKWMHYDSESGEKEPYSKWKKNKKDSEDSKDDVEDSSDVNDAAVDLDGFEVAL